MLEEQGHGSVLKSLPIPNSFPQGNEMQEFNYAFINTNPDPDEPSVGQNRRWTQGSSMDGRGEFKEIKAQPYGDEPQLAPPMPIGYAQAEQMAEAGNKQ